MTCPNCQTELMTQSQYCADCGTPVARRQLPPRYAGFWRRVAATAIDVALFWPLIVILSYVFGLAPTAADLSNMRQIDGISDAERIQEQMQFMLQFGYLMALTDLVLAPYYILMETSAWQGTIGKRLLGIQVTDMGNHRIRLGKAVVRYLGRNLAAIPWQAGFVMAGFTAKKQGLHDMLAGTLVVKRRKDSTRGPEW